MIASSWTEPPLNSTTEVTIPSGLTECDTTRNIGHLLMVTRLATYCVCFR